MSIHVENWKDYISKHPEEESEGVFDTVRLDGHKCFHNSGNREASYDVPHGIGVFEFDDREYDIAYYENRDVCNGVDYDDLRLGLRYTGHKTEGIVIPNGATDISQTFAYTSVPIKVAPVIPESVLYHDDAFMNCSEEVQKAGTWNIEHRGKDYYIDGPGADELPRKGDFDRDVIDSTGDSSSSIGFELVD